MAAHSPRVGVGSGMYMHQPHAPMSGTSMPIMAGMGHVDSAAGDTGYHPYRPAPGRADRLMANIMGDTMGRGMGGSNM